MFCRKDIFALDWNDLQYFMRENQNRNIIVTAPTGYGKTEAGLLWAGNHKCFFVLPLRTAINAMYERIGKKILGNQCLDERLALLHADIQSYYVHHTDTDIDENSYIRDNKHIMIDGIINIDFLRGNKVLHEIKKSKSIEEAGIMQVKYYLYYLNKKGLPDMTAKIDYPLLKQSISVELSEGDMTELEQIIHNIVEISDMDYAPSMDRLPICKKCAYYDLCFI